jgi:hypothetical protein
MYDCEKEITKMKLNECPVVFDEILHTYELDGKQLSGITSLLDRQLFPDKYSGVSKVTLDRAKMRGSLVHQQIELHDELGTEADTPLLLGYEHIKEKYGLKVMANEYLVSDLDHVASSIDIVFEGNILCDIKTTSQLYKDYVSWQLSIYAYLYELQNPGEKVEKLVALWIPKQGRMKLVEVERKPSEWCRELIACDQRGEQYTIPSLDVNVNQLMLPQQVMQQLISLEQEYKNITQTRKELHQGLLEQMIKHNIKSFKADGLTLSYKEATTRESIDTKLLKDKYPEIYAECLKESQVKESITIKIN